MPTAPSNDLNPTILLVDTDADTREIYELAFALEGFRTASSASAFEAFAAAQDLAPAVIVADVGPPGRTQTFEMLRWLRTNDETRRIPVVALTGYDLPVTGDAGARFERVLLKPVTPDALVASARSALSRSKVLQQRARRLPASRPTVLHRSPRALARSPRWAGAQTTRLRCPKCRALLTHAFKRVSGSTLRQYRPCINGCGLFYYDPANRRMVPLVR